ncbi:voltage-gated potassium channel Kch [Abditibacteriota bacterium]|nr:voltage-gated potassium channel Kch [Abditibacteriota bacterium]
MNGYGKNSLVLAILSALSLLVVACALGFYHFEKPETPTLTLWDCFWWAMVTVTTIGYGDIFPHTLGGRLIALFLMMAGIGSLSFLTAAIASFLVGGDGWQQIRLRRFKRHIIVCGLGKRGLLLVRAFCARGAQVVALEHDEENESVAVARDLGAVVLVGDARERGLLKNAGIERAQTVIALCGNDSSNAEVAARVRDFAAHRSTSFPLICSVHIVEPDLWGLLREWEIAGRGAFRLQFFNLVDAAARALLDEHPAFTLPATSAPHLLIVGAGRLGRSLIVNSARAWHDAPTSPESRTGEKLRCLLIDRDAEKVAEILHLRHPELGATCELSTLALDTSDSVFHRAEFLFDENGKCRISRVYVCLHDDATGLVAALALHGRLRSTGVPVVAAMQEESGLTSLLRDIRGAGRRFESLHAVGLMERACQPDLVMGGVPELLARALHERYLEENESEGVSAESNPLLVAWDELPEDARESNRAQALHIGEKLAAIECDIAPLWDWNARTHEFSPEEIDLMARLEHERWLAERFSLGWKLGPRDPENKTNPNLRPWDELSPGVRDWNCNVVRAIPAFLAGAGFQVLRLSPLSADDPAPTIEPNHR